MHVLVVGSGPVGSFLAVALARRGNEVTLLDRDAGPGADGSWRRSVMQVDLPHFFRPQVRHALEAEVPELWSALLLAGGVPALPPGLPPEATGLQCRRRTFERVVWSFVDAEPGVRRVHGLAEGLTVRRGRVTGVLVGGVELAADLVLVATGRSMALGDELRAPAEGAPCSHSYTARQFAARPGVELPSWGMPRFEQYDGYGAIVFPQDAGTLSALFLRPTHDKELARTRDPEVFAAVAAQVPLLAEWTDPERFEPASEVRSGSNLWNSYRGQRSESGTTTPGVVFVGDAVCTTDPAYGRGVVLGLRQAQQLLALIDDRVEPLAQAFDDWCAESIRPWYLDHVAVNESLHRRFAGEALDLDAPLPPDVVCECAQVDPSILAAAIPYFAMLAPPSVLDGAQEAARAVLRTGWRPAYAPGPSRDEVVAALLAPVG